MSSEQRMILRRHHAAFLELGPPEAAKRAAMRAADALGITRGDTARFFGVCRTTVICAIYGRRGSRGVPVAQLLMARAAIARGERSLRSWRGREAAAMARLERGNWPIPEERQ